MSALKAPHTTDELDTALQALALARPPVYNVLGNHCLQVALPRAQLVQRLGLPPSAFAVDALARILLVRLDGTDVSVNGDGTGQEAARQWLSAHADEAHAQTWNGGVGPAQLAWLRSVLERARQERQYVLVCGHYPLLASVGGPRHLLWNHDEVRRLLGEYRGTVVAYMSGHFHPGGRDVMGGIIHWGVPAVLEGAPGFVLRVWADAIVVQTAGTEGDSADFVMHVDRDSL